MASKIRRIHTVIGFLFFCPGCKQNHMVNTVKGQTPYWEFDDDDDCPTMSPSYLINIPEAPGHYPAVRCHSFIRNGRIEFLSDCTHELRGQTVDLPDWEE